MNLTSIFILLTALIGLANADAPAVLNGLRTVEGDLGSLEQAIKATDDRLRTLLAVIHYEGVLETDIQVATFHVWDSPLFNEIDSKAVTEAAMKMKPAIEVYLKTAIAKKTVLEHLSYHEIIVASIRFFQANTNRLGKALQDKVDEASAKAIKECSDKLNDSFVQAIAALDPVEWIAHA
ncbi:cell wall mannoprotein 1 family protein [Aspergillus candidus]|uniref:Hydrophobic surface binding protein A-domain-containing protein n=1 Tax=Aspergillus candidus TaxID=41067 RepID=A0A2I2FMN2_ASPCN|nr:hypothetical protein BDW47DRAFT_98747 [Aspergillus candidus]PLB41893.1 hypothetical protein BDW47DRAFT_98747 [Aspergillus candidus]